jgi:hypothetical protein
MTTPLRDVDGQPLTFRRGTSPSHTFAVKVAETGLPKSLIGATEVSLAIGATKAAASRLLLLTLADGMSHDGAGGVVTATFTIAQTEALPPGQLWAELWIRDAAGNRDLVAAGSCVVFESLINVA